MILIISQPIESTTDLIIDWITHFGGEVIRLNGVDFYQNTSIVITNSGMEIKVKDLDWNKINVIWFRRWVGFEDAEKIFIKKFESKDSLFINDLNEFIRRELKTWISFFFESLPSEKFFSLKDPEELNKLIVLKKAQELGILIPETYVLSNTQALSKLHQEKKIITKAIFNATQVSDGDESFFGYTAIVGKIPEFLGAHFSPSLFQEAIDKKYEIRSFLLNKKLYSMAIFSQLDAQTQIDFRMYNFYKPNTTVPFQLPAELEGKLIRLAEQLGLRAGSFDIIKTTKNEYVFLEINQEGQFGMVSYPCNYYLEKEFALELIKLDKHV